MSLNLSKFKLFLIFFLTGIIISIANRDLYAATYYVSPTGSASWSQSQNINSPASLTTAMASAVAGDTVYFRGGTYRLPKVVPEGGGLRPVAFPAHSGQLNKEIVFKAYNGETPFLDNSSNQGSTYCVPSYGTYGNSYIIWDGINTKAIPDRNKMAKGVSIAANSSNIILRNAAIEGYTNGHSNNNCIRIENAKDVLIENCKIWNANSTSADHNNSGIMLYHGEGVTVRKCDIFNCYTGVYDKKDATRNKYYQNHLYNLKKGFLICGKWESADNVEIFKNVIRNCSVSSVELFDAINGGNLANTKVYNNTFCNSSGVAFTGDDGNEFGTEFYNNIVYDASTAVRFYKTPSFVDYNSYFKVSKLSFGSTYYTSSTMWSSSTAYDKHSLSQDPKLKNAGGASLSDYLPQSGSPCIGAGKNGQTIGTYANASDNLIVGYRTGGSSGGSSPTDPLQSPQNLRIVSN